MGDKALALRRYAPSGLVLYRPYVPIGHDLCNTYSTCTKDHNTSVNVSYPEKNSGNCTEVVKVDIKYK